MKRRITISADVPSEANDEEIASYVTEALGSWGGQSRPPGAYGDDDPGDPIFGGIRVNSVAIRGTTFTNS